MQERREHGIFYREMHSEWNAYGTINVLLYRNIHSEWNANGMQLFSINQLITIHKFQLINIQIFQT